MVALFVHGVPDDGRLWDDVRSQLPDVPSIAVSLPGFHSPVPNGFTATKEAYADWLLDTLAELGEPVDLVGHGWGSILAVRVISVRPGVVRSLAVGGCSPEGLDSEIAQTWQAPGVGEELMAAFGGPDPEYVQLLMEGGVPRYAALRSVFDDPLSRQCILRLYRSAVDLPTTWGAAVRPARVPSLVLWGADDPFSDSGAGARLAARLGAPLRTFDDCGHWYPYQRATETAAELRKLWNV